MRVTYYKRKPFKLGNFSIERVFDDICGVLDVDCKITIREARFVTRGIVRRVLNILEAPLYQGEINHITGDIHYVALLLSKKKTVITMHDCVILNRSYGIKRFVLFLFWYWLPFCRAAVVTTVSEAAKQELVGYLKCSPDRIVVIYNPVSEIFRPIGKSFNSIKPRILQIGVSENKNIHRVAEALEDIPCHLRIIGQLSREQIEILARENVEYSFVANLSNEEIAEEYQKCDFLIFASTYEGFGLPIVEAQATGRPVITSDISSMIEVAGDSACLVNPFDVNSIRSGVLKIVGDASYREDLILRGYENIIRFRRAHIANEYSKLYKKIYTLASE